MHSDRHVIASTLSLMCFVAVATLVPTTAAQHLNKIQMGMRAVPVSDADVVAARAKLKLPGVFLATSDFVFSATEFASMTSVAQTERKALDVARVRFETGDLRGAKALARAVIHECETQNAPKVVELGQRARILLANINFELGDYQAVYTALAGVVSTPIDDYVLWLRAQSYEAEDKHAAAAEVYQNIVRMDTRLQHKATVRAAHTLFAAKNWQHARERLNHVIQTYPDYPRRHRALFEYATALDKLGLEVDAADAYQQTLFEFPYRREGKAARVRLESMLAQGTAPSKMYTADELFKRYRRLRINKHWDVARAMFTQLAEDHASLDGHSEFEHAIAFQLMLNDYGSRAYGSAITRLRELETCYKTGFTDGIHLPSVYKYLSRSNSRMGRIDEALAALTKQHQRESAKAQQMARAAFYQDHGKYTSALRIYEELRTAAQKRTWDHTWLLYKAGHYDDAFENLINLAEGSSGRRRARYMYWAARTLENAKKFRDAKAIYREVHSAHPSRYYGLQAANRILDIDQRKSRQPVLANAEQLSNAADYVLDAMDEAELALGTSRAEAADPRGAQRGAFSQPKAAVTSTQCEAEAQAELDFCRLEVGDLPEPAVDVMRAAFSSASTVGSILAVGLGTTDFVSHSADNDDIPELDSFVGPEVRVPIGAPSRLGESLAKRQYNTPGRIHWNGRFGSTGAFAKFRDHKIYGPLPDRIKAYDEDGYEGGLDRAAQALGDIFPGFVRATWLFDAGMHGEARWAARNVAIEFRALSRRWRAGAKPHELDNFRWSYYIDNRRKGQAGTWGIELKELRYPVPTDKASAAQYLARQRRIFDDRVAMKPVVMDALKEVGDHFMVRKMTLGTGGWYRRDPTGPARTSWMQAYPRAYPELVMRQAKKNGVNPYLLWALMTVESSYNPDSVSPADAMGLLQVIPRTGLKTALMLGDENFGPHDLLEAETAVQHGAFYFSELLHKFRGQELLAFAGYNGGPHRLGDWLDMRGDGEALDEFIEEIPFDEARGYAKKVARFVALYLRIYEGHDGLYIGQELRSDYRALPKF